MSLHIRQHSDTFYSPDKSQGNYSQSTGSPTGMMCSYPSSSMYPGGSGIGGAGNWSINSRQSYTGVDPTLEQDQQRRWLDQQDSSFRPRDKALDCRTMRSPSSTLSEQLPSHSQGLSSSLYPGSSHHRPSTYQSPYGRNMSAETQPPMSSWNSWDMDNSSAVSMNGQYPRFNDGQPSWAGQLNVEIPQFDQQAYADLLLSGSDSSSSTIFTPGSDQAIPLNGFNFPHRLSPGLSPSPSPVPEHTFKRSPGPNTPPLPPSHKSGEDHPELAKSCSHCRATSTPLWRRDPSTMKPLCNACGLYLQQRNKLRPQELIDADDDGSSSDESDPNYVGPECSHCRTHHTSVWRRSKTGDQLCNACGVYARLRGKPRPLTLKKHKIRPRSKHSPK